MAEPDIRDRLQPALLDRLTDDAPANLTESEAQRVMSKAALRKAVLRDLAWLFNATQTQHRPAGPPQPQAQAQTQTQTPSHTPSSPMHPAVANSVLNYGLPPLAGQRVSRLDVHELERIITQAIHRFEPRILPDTLQVRAIESDNVLHTHNMIEFEIRGQLWAQPVPLEILLRTRMDLEAGQVEVSDAAAPVFTTHLQRDA